MFWQERSGFYSHKTWSWITVVLLNCWPWTSKEASQDKFRPSSSSLVVSESQAGSPGAGRSGAPWSRRVGLGDVKICPEQVMLISVPANGFISSISRIGGGKPVRKGKRESKHYFSKLAATSVLSCWWYPSGRQTRRERLWIPLLLLCWLAGAMRWFWKFENFSITNATWAYLAVPLWQGEQDVFSSYRFLSHLKSLYLGISSSVHNHSVSRMV